MSLRRIFSENLLIYQLRQKHGHKRADGHANQAWDHEAMIEQVLTDDCRTRPVEVYRGDITWVVRDEEVAIDTWQNTQQDWPRNA